MKRLEITLRTGAKLEVDAVDAWTQEYMAGPVDRLVDLHSGRPRRGTRWLRFLDLGEVAAIVEVRRTALPFESIMPGPGA